MKKHLAFDIAYLVFAGLFAYMATQGSIDMSCHGVAIDSDLQTYAQSLARDRFPDFFTTDPAMQIGDNASIIPNIETYLASKLCPDEPAIGLLRAGGVSLFLFFALWYALGVWLLHIRPLAALLALASSITVWVGWGTFWGMLHSDPVPRSFYAALWPLILMLGAMACRTPILRPAVMLATGLTIWVHGISALCSGAMLASAFAFIRDRHQTFRAHATIFALSVIAFLVPVCLYLSSTFFTDKIISAEDQQIIQTFFGIRWKKDYSSNLQTLLDIINFTNIIPYIFILGLLASISNIKSSNQSIVLATKMYFYFLIGIFVTFSVSLLESIIVYKTNRIPLGHELVRGIRFTIPLSIIMITCYLHKIYGKIGSVFQVIIFIFVFIVVFYVSKDKQIIALQHFISDNIHIEFPMTKFADNVKKVSNYEYDAIKQIENLSAQNELIFTPDEVLQLRYIVFRPIIYTFKEGYIYYYRKDVKGIKYWLYYNNIIESYSRGYLDAWKNSGARLLLCSSSRDKNDILQYGSIIWQNKYWIIAEIK